MEVAEGWVLIWGAQVPPCLWHEQLEREGKDAAGLGHNLDDPVQPLSFTLSMEHSKTVTGESSGQCFGQETQRQLVCFNHSTGVSWGLLSGEQMCGLGREEGGDKAGTGKGKGNFVLQLCCISSQELELQCNTWLHISLQWLPKCFLPTCSATGREVLWEHRVLILPGSSSGVKKMQKIKF